MIDYDSLPLRDRALLARAAETSPLAFFSHWYTVTQGERPRINWHHHYYDYAAQEMLAGRATNIIINVPPGGTKTEFFSVHLPPYAMATRDRVRVLNTCYSKDLADEASERARVLAFGHLAPLYRWTPGKAKADDWVVMRGHVRAHQLTARSSGGQILGSRGGYITEEYSGHVTADDWDKADDMFSDVRRERSHTRLTNTLRSRRACSRTPFIFVQQRLHIDDSTAYLLRGDMGLTVDLHIKIPSLINQDYIDALPDGIRERCIRDVCHTEQIDGYWSYWPEKETVQDLAALREAHPYTFNSQNQQEPEAVTGELFDPSHFEFYDEPDEPSTALPVLAYRFITADTAQKQSTRNDWTVFREWGVGKEDGRLYALSQYRGRPTAKHLRRDFESFVKSAHNKNCGTVGNLRAVLVEDKSSGTGLIQEMEGRLPVNITPVQRGTDKFSRAIDTMPHHAARKVVLPWGAAENIEFMAEVGKFRADMTHAFDDQVDTMMDAIEHVYIKPQIRSGKRAGTW